MKFNATKYPNILLITGNGKNVGKTTLSCKIIQRQKHKFDFVAVKISTHFHDYKNDDKVVFRNDDIIIIEEIKHNTGKDSSKMLDAGAKRVFFMMVKDENLPIAFDKLMEILNFTSNPMIIESTSLRAVVEPSIFVVIQNIRTKNVKEYLKPFLSLVDVNIDFDGEKFNFDDEKIFYNGEKWLLKN